MEVWCREMVLGMPCGSSAGKEVAFAIFFLGGLC